MGKGSKFRDVSPKSLPELQLATARMIRRDTVNLRDIADLMNGHLLLIQGQLKGPDGRVAQELHGQSGFYDNILTGISSTLDFSGQSRSRNDHVVTRRCVENASPPPDDDSDSYLSKWSDEEAVENEENTTDSLVGKSTHPWVPQNAIFDGIAASAENGPIEDLEIFTQQDENESEDGFANVIEVVETGNNDDVVGQEDVDDSDDSDASPVSTKTISHGRFRLSRARNPN